MSVDLWWVQLSVALTSDMPSLAPGPELGQARPSWAKGDGLKMALAWPMGWKSQSQAMWPQLWGNFPTGIMVND
jgi:hypothetical protein